MLDATKIANEVFQSRMYSMDLLSDLVSFKNQGEDTCNCENKYIVLVKWIEILENYLVDNYEQNGELIEPPPTECLTLDQINELIAKMKVLRGSHTYAPSSDWILAYGAWRDAGFWRDSSMWLDYLPIV